MERSFIQNRRRIKKLISYQEWNGSKLITKFYPAATENVILDLLVDAMIAGSLRQSWSVEFKRKNVQDIYNMYKGNIKFVIDYYEKIVYF